MSTDNQPEDRDPTPAEKGAIFSRINSLTPRPDLQTALVFVIDCNDEEVEMSRDTVTGSDIPLLARAYFMLPTWPQRVALVHLVQDHQDDILKPVWLDILRAPRRELCWHRSARSAGDSDRLVTRRY